MLAPHWAQLLSPIGEQHRLSVPECVRTRLLLSRHSVLYLSGSFKVVRARETFIFYFTNQKRNYRWLGKTFGRTIPICTSFLFSRPAPFSRTLHFLVFPTLSHLPHYLRAWDRLKSFKCWWGQCVLGMRAISRICGNKRQGSISATLSVLFPELLLVIEPTRPTTSRKAGYAPGSANLRADIVSSV